MCDVRSAPRVVSFANSAIAIEHVGDEAARLLEFLYRHLPSTADVPPHRRFCLKHNDGMFVLHRDESLLYRSTDAGAVAEQLMGETCYHLADKSHGGLLLHAAAVAWQGQGILLPGATGAGKSTLTAWLLHQRFTYLTDEMVFVPQQTQTMHAFTRPLNLKLPSRPILRSLLDEHTQLTQVVSSPRVDMIPPTLFNATAPSPTAPLRLILFPRYQPESPGQWRTLSPAQAGLALMQCLANARNLPGHGFAQVASLARAVPAYSVRYANFRQIAAHLAQIQPM